MTTSMKPILCTTLLVLACAIETADDVELRGGELEASSGEAACGDASQLVPGDDTKLYTVLETDLVVLHDGVDSTVDPKTGIVYLDDGFTGIQCRCNSGCSEILPCTAGGDATTKTCSGDCVGTDGDGQSCGRCTWHTVDVPPPVGGAPGSVDPTGDSPGKPPGSDPTAGDVDPTWGGGELPPFDPPPGELDPTK